MKLALDESVELEFNEWTLQQAGERIQEIRRHNGDRADDVLRGVLTLLLFAQMEQQNPGVVRRLMSTAENLAQTLNGPKANLDE